jgi:hypothetical protein
LFGQSTDENGGRFLTKLERFTERVTTDETLGTCQRTWVGSNPPPGCNGGSDDPPDPPDPPGPGSPTGGGGSLAGAACTYEDVWSNEAYEGSETFDVPDGASIRDYCFFDGSTLEDSIVTPDADGNDIYEIVWDRSWFPDLAGITDGGSVGCCNQDDPNGFNCIEWEAGGAGGNAGDNVYRRVNTSDDCRESLP